MIDAEHEPRATGGIGRGGVGGGGGGCGCGPGDGAGAPVARRQGHRHGSLERVVTVGERLIEPKSSHDAIDVTMGGLLGSPPTRAFGPARHGSRPAQAEEEGWVGAVEETN